MQISEAQPCLFSVGITELQRRVIHIHYFYFLLNSRLKARVVFLKSAAFSGRIFCEAEIFVPLSEVNGSVPPTSYSVDSLCSAPHLPHRAGPRDVQIPVTSEQRFLYLPTCLDDPHRQAGSCSHQLGVPPHPRVWASLGQRCAQEEVRAEQREKPKAMGTQHHLHK